MTRSETPEHESILRVLLGVDRLSPRETAFVLDSNMRVGIAFSTIFVVLEAFMLINNIILASDPAIVERVGWSWIIQHRIGYLIQFFSALILMIGCLYHSFRRHLSGAVGGLLIAQCLFCMLVLGSYAAYGDLLRGNGIYAMITQIIAVACIFIIRPVLTLPVTFLSLEVILYAASRQDALTHGLLVNVYVFYALVVVAACVRYLFAIRVARSNEILAHKSLTDELTGIWNVRAFRSDAQSCPKSTITLSVLDMDDFKAYNDHCGHLTGDLILECMANTLVRVFGDTARCYRLGGDEFLVASSQMSIEEQEARLRRAEAALQESAIADQLCPEFGFIRFSHGTVSGTVESYEDVLDLEREADRIMYESKKSAGSTRR